MLGAGALVAAVAATIPGIATLRFAQATLSPEGGEPREFESLTLPHRWDKSFPNDAGRAVYRLELPPAMSGAPHALFFPRIGNQAEILVNGKSVGSLGQLGNPGSDHAKRPVWIDLHRDWLHTTGSTPLEIRISTQANRWGGLSAPLFGPASDLRPLYDTNYRWRQVASGMIVLSLGLMALMAGGLWWKQRDGLYGLLALTALFGIIRMGDRLLVHPPLPWPLWGAVTAAAFITHLMLMARFALQAIGETGPWIRQGFWVTAAGGSFAAFASFFFRLPWLWTATLAATVIPGMVVLVCVVRRALLTHSRQSTLLCAAGFVVILAGFRDFFVVRLPESGSESFSILPHAVFVFVLFMGWIVVERYSRQFVDYRELNNSLEKRIAEREAELGASYARLAQQSEQQATLQERQRIMRDIHDGVGAHLVSLLSLVKRGDIPADRLQAEIHVALDELRVAVDSLQPVHGDLTTVLATLRYRLQPRLEAAGLEVGWNVAELPALASLAPQMVLQIQRVLLEAFTNVLRHAKATRIDISAWALDHPPALVLEVSDNGIGFAAAPERQHGLGMQSMQSRSQAIGAALLIESVPGQGTRVRLTLPNP